MDISEQRNSELNESNSPDYSKLLKKVVEVANNNGIHSEENWVKCDFATLQQNPSLSRMGLFPTTVLALHRKNLMMKVVRGCEDLLDKVDSSSEISSSWKVIKWIVRKVWSGVKILGNILKNMLGYIVRGARLVLKGLGKGLSLAKKGIAKAASYLTKSEKFKSVFSKFKPLMAKINKITKPVVNWVGRSLEKFNRSKILEKTMAFITDKSKLLINKATAPGAVKKLFRAKFVVKMIKGTGKLLRFVPFLGAAVVGGFELYDLRGRLEAIQALLENKKITEEEAEKMKTYSYATSGAAVGAEIATNLISSTALGLTTGVGALLGGAIGIAAGETARYVVAKSVTDSDEERLKFERLFTEGQVLLDEGYQLKNEVKVDESRLEYGKELGKKSAELTASYQKQVDEGLITAEEAKEKVTKDLEDYQKTRTKPNESSTPENPKPQVSTLSNKTISSSKQREQLMFTPIPSIPTSTNEIKMANPNVGFSQMNVDITSSENSIKPIPQLPELKQQTSIPQTKSIPTTLPTSFSKDLDIVNNGYRV